VITDGTSICVVGGGGHCEIAIQAGPKIVKSMVLWDWLNIHDIVAALCEALVWIFTDRGSSFFLSVMEPIRPTPMS
jgi:hypothetical protein